MKIISKPMSLELIPETEFEKAHLKFLKTIHDEGMKDYMRQWVEAGEMGS